MTLSIHHIAINTRDPAPIASIYETAVQFKALESASNPRWLAAPNGFIALYPTALPTRDTEHRVCDPGIGHFCIQSGDSDGTWNTLTCHGITFSAQPTGLGTGVLYAYGRDLESNLIEVEGVSNEAPTTPPWMAHVALVSSDLERLADFYVKLIGRPCHREGTFSNPAFKAITGFDDVKVKAKWIMADNLIFEMWQYLNPETRGVRLAGIDEPGYRHVGFACDNLEAEVERIAAVGIATVKSQPLEGLPCVTGTDPDGNRFLIVEATSGTHPLALSSLAAPNFVSDRLSQNL